MPEYFPLKTYGNGNYEISRCGKVRHKILQKDLKVTVGNRGYPCVIITDTTLGRKHSSGRVLLHRALACTFIPNPDNKRTINHKDGNKLNYALDNLEWATDQENIEHAFATNLNEHSEKHYQSKLTNDQVREIRALKGIKKLRDVAPIYGVSETTIVNIMNRKVYKRVI